MREMPNAAGDRESRTAGHQQRRDPLTTQDQPLPTCDVREHAYYMPVSARSSQVAKTVLLVRARPLLAQIIQILAIEGRKSAERWPLAQPDRGNLEFGSRTLSASDSTRMRPP